MNWQVQLLGRKILINYVIIYRVVLPATIHGEITLSKAMNVEETLRKAISKKQNQSQTIALLENCIAICLQTIWVVLIVYLGPYLSGIRDFKE